MCYFVGNIQYGRKFNSGEQSGGHARDQNGRDFQENGRKSRWRPEQRRIYQRVHGRSVSLSDADGRSGRGLD